MNNRVMRGLTVTLIVTAALVAGGCTSDDDAPPQSRPAESTPTGSGQPDAQGGPAAPAVPALEELWAAQLGGEGYGVAQDASGGRTGALTVWSVGGAIAIADSDGVRAVDAATGAAAWEWEVPRPLGSVCVAGDPAATEVVAVVAGRGQRCDTVVALDLRNGRELWRAVLDDDVDHRNPDRVPYVAPDRVVVPTFCGPTQVFALRRGTPLPDLTTPTTDGACDARVWIRDGVAVLMETNGPSEPDVLSATDLSTDRLLWRAPSRRISDLNAVLSSDPVVLDVSDRRQQVARIFDERSRPGRAIGLTWSNPTTLGSLGVLDGTLVASYDTSADLAGHHFGFCVDDGAVDWVTRYGRQQVLGRYGEALLVLGGDADEFETAAVLGRAAATDPSSGTALGTFALPDTAEVGWSEDLLLVRDGGLLTAYRISEAGDTPLPALTGLVPETAPEDHAGDADYALCHAIGTDTLAALGVPDLGLPPPAGCEWYVDGFSGVDVHTDVFLDSEQAADQGVDLVFDGYTQLERPSAVPLPGVGDEAVVGTRRASGSVTVQLVARHANLVIGVRATNNELGPTATESDVAAMQASAIQAVEQMVAAAPLAQEG